MYGVTMESNIFFDNLGREVNTHMYEDRDWDGVSVKGEINNQCM